MTPIFGATVVERQIALAKSAGAGRIYLLTEDVSGEVLAVGERAAEQGIRLRAVGALSDIADEDRSAQMLLLADGVLFETEFASALGKVNGGLVLAIPSDGRPSPEPIDLHRQWSGIALIPGAMLSEMDDLPSDWDQFSALFRTALRSNIPVETMDGADIGNSGIVMLSSAEEVSAYEKRDIKQQTVAANQSITERLLAPTMPELLPRLWNSDWLGILPMALSLICLLGALGLAVFGMTVPTLLSLWVSSMALFVGRPASTWKTGPASSRWPEVGISLSIAAVLIILIYRVSPADLHTVQGVLVIVAAVILLDLDQSGESGRFGRFRPDLPIVLLLLLLLSIVAGWHIALEVVVLALAAFRAIGVLTHKGKGNLG